MSAEPSSVLFVGLGAMGAPMVEQLSAAGYDLHVHDADPTRARSLARSTGTHAAEDLHAPPRADAVILMLPDSTAVRSVLLGEADSPGLLAVVAETDLIIDMSSSQPTSTVAIADQARQHGIELVDAPVSGGVARAKTGELSIMFGGPEATLQRCHPLLSAMGSSVSHTGPAGSAHAMKSLNNLLSAIGLVGASEVLSVGSRFGLEPEVMLRVLNNSTGRNHATEVKLAKHVLSREFDSGFPMRLMVKDLRTALDLAHDTRATAPLAAACLEACLGAQNTLDDPSADHTEVARYVERNAGTELTSAPKGHE